MTASESTPNSLQGKLKEWILTKNALVPLLRRYRLHTMGGIPPEVNIETTSICNARCIMCPIEQLDRPKKAMNMELYKKIVDDCVEIGVKCIKLHNFGEPLLTPGFDEMLHYIRSKSPAIEIQLATNGSLLNDNWAHIMIREKVNRVIITVDGARKETYEKVRVGLKYDTVTENIRHFMDVKRNMRATNPKVYVDIIEMKETKDEVETFLKCWEGVVDHVAVTTYSTRAGTLPGNEFGLQPRPCFRLWKQMVVTNTGEVATCCADWNCKSILGDIRNQSVSEIWHGQVVERLRRMHLEGRANEIALCKGCNPSSWDTMPDWWFKSVPCK